MGLTIIELARRRAAEDKPEEKDQEKEDMPELSDEMWSKLLAGAGEAVE